MVSMDKAADLAGGLETALLRELAATWRLLNSSHFKDGMKAPLVELFDSATRLGLWSPAERTIRLSRQLVGEQPWGVVVEVLKHEMAHQYVHEVLHERDETAHGARFHRLCLDLGIDAAASGLPSTRTPDDPAARVLQRVAKLLALAQSANRHEAESAMATARRLLLKYNLDVQAAQSTHSTAASYTFRQVGPITGRISEVERRVSVLLSEHFFVEAIWVPAFSVVDGRRGRVLELCGTPTNLDLAEYAHGFVHHAAAQLWLAHKRAHPDTPNRDRATFLGGVARGFSERLADEQKRAQREEALVWLGDKQLLRYYRRRHPHVRQMRHAARPNSSHASGREAGRGIVLHRGLTTQSSPSSGAPKLLR